MPYSRRVSADKQQFIERFSAHWTAQGGNRIEGQIAGFLLIDDSPGLSSGHLATELGISAGAVSMHTRSLLAKGFILRTRSSTGRSHLFTMAPDVWAGFLQAETRYLQQQRDLARTALAGIPPDSPAHKRIQNMHAYMAWISALDLPARWEEHKALLAGPSAHP